MENLTNQIENEAMEYINTIDDLGGAPKAIEKGYIQKEIQNSAYRHQMEVESLEKIVVGVNKFQTEETEKKELLKVDPEVEKNQKEKLIALKGERDNEAVENTLEILREKANTDENLMPYILEAVKAYATLGEICNVLRDVFGEYQQSIIFREEFYMDKPIRVLVAKPGLDGHDRGAKVIARSLRDAGMEVIYTGLRQTPAQIVAAAIQEDVDIVAISILSGAHNHLFPRVIELLKEEQAEDILVIGGGVIPEDDIPFLKEAGVKAIFTPGTSTKDVVEFINNALER